MIVSLKKIKQLLSFAVVCFYPIVALGFLGFTKIDRQITSGDELGFAIGSSKIELYDFAHELFNQGKIIALDAWSSGSQIRDTKCHSAFKPREISDVHGYFGERDYWALINLPDKNVQLIGFNFVQDSLRSIRLVDEKGVTSYSRSWKPDSDSVSVEITYGELRSTVYKKLHQIAAEAEYEKLRIVTGWLAQKETPQFHPEDYYLIRDLDVWHIYLDSTQLNTIKLIFEGNKLKSISREKRYYRIPGECLFG